MAVLEPLILIESIGTHWIVQFLTMPIAKNRDQMKSSFLVLRVLISWLESPIIKRKAHLQSILPVIQILIIIF